MPFHGGRRRKLEMRTPQSERSVQSGSSRGEFACLGRELEVRGKVFRHGWIARAGGLEGPVIAMNGHAKLVALLHLVLSAMNLFAAALIFLLLSGAGWLSHDVHAMHFLTAFGGAIAAFLMVLALPGFIGGVGLLMGQSWARMVLLVLGFFELFHFPLGTALGAYTLWALWDPRKGS